MVNFIYFECLLLVKISSCLGGQMQRWVVLSIIQIKYFYSGQAYNPYTGSYQKAVLIWQFDCDEGGCFLTSYNPHLPDPNNPTYIPYVYTTLLRVDWYNLYDNCCYGPDNPECNWANGHCYGCFAPDDSASQNFAWVDRVGWEPIPQS